MVARALSRVKDAVTPGPTWIGDAVEAIARAATVAEVLAQLAQRAVSLPGVISASIAPAVAPAPTGAERFPIDPEIASPAGLILVSAADAFTTEGRVILGILTRMASSRLDVLTLVPESLPLPTASGLAEMSEDERRAADERILRVEQDLHEAHARLELALDAADVGFWEFFPSTGRAFHSRSWKRQLGLEGAYVAADESAFLDRLHPDDRDRVSAQRIALVGRTIDRMDVECRVMHQDGSYRTILARGAAFRDAAGEVQCLRGVHIDVSSRRAVEDATRRLNELAEQNRAVQTASRLKSEFLANMSHELRTPLNTIIGFAEVLLDNKVGTLDDAHREFVGDILSSGRHLLALINDVLDLSKVEAGKMEFYPVKIDVAELFSEVRSIVRELAARKRIRLSIDIEEGLTSVRLDAGRLKQVLYNYLSNAIKFTPPGGSVWMRARTDGEGQREVQFEVEDTGPGIPPDRLGLLFVEFQQLDASSTRQHGGTGLGLALTRRLVTAQGGRVGVRSAVGEGSAFFAVLPREMMTEGTFESIAPAAPLVSVRQGSPALLVVEDSAEDRAWLVGTLLTAGYAVQAATSVESALLLARAYKFDAITVDLLLPDGDGFSLVQRIRQEGLQVGVPVVLISVASTGDAARGLLVHDALMKPLEPAELLASLHRLGVATPARQKVFVVDDEASLLREATHVLRDAGYEVSSFSTGESAVAAALESPPDAIVLDLMLDDTDGFSVLERLRESEVCRRTPVVIWTGATLGNTDLEKLKSAHRVIDKSATHTTALVGVLDDLLRPPAVSTAQVGQAMQEGRADQSDQSDQAARPTEGCPA